VHSIAKVKPTIEIVYEKSICTIGLTLTNDLDLCLEVARSCQPLRHVHSPLNISENVRDRGLVPIKGPPMACDCGHVIDDVT